MKTFRLICVFASILLIANSQTLYCSDTYPGRQQACPLIYSPVCANYPQKCLVRSCPQVQEFSNACEACANRKVDSYVDGPCETEGGIGEGEAEGEYGENYENYENVEYGEGEFNEEGYLDGRIWCVNSPMEVVVACPANYLPVCGYINGEDVGITYANDCEACAGGKADYYLPGACPGDEELMEVL